MKMVLAFIQPHKVNAVTQALEHVSDFHGMSVSRADGFGRERFEETSEQRDRELEPFSAKVRIEAVVRTDQVDAVVEAIAQAATTGRYGDGMIFVFPIERAVRIKNLQEGEDQL